MPSGVACEYQKSFENLNVTKGPAPIGEILKNANTEQTAEITIKGPLPNAAATIPGVTQIAATRNHCNGST
jgi:hypothetical protein